MDKIAVIANFAGERNRVGGQVLKTQIITNELSRRTDWDIVKVDTDVLKSDPIVFLRGLLETFLRIKNVIVMVSTNGRKLLFPLLWFFSTFLKKNVYHIVNGGALAQEAKKSFLCRMYLNSFQKNFVESRLLAKELKESGVKNAGILPNFRSASPLSEEGLETSFAEPYSFCTFSLVTREKGIEDAITAIKRVNERNGRAVCQLHIFGPVDHAYKRRFDMLMQGAGPNVRYEGTAAHDKAIQTLRPFYATLFPTFWPGESCAGTISDSFCAGVPVLATDWRCNSEMIRDGYNGIIYPGKTAATLEDAIQWVIDHRTQMPQIKKNCLKAAEAYQADAYMPRFIRLLEKNEEKRKRKRRR